MKHIPIQLIVAFVFLLSNCHAQSLAFEGALGFGKYTSGNQESVSCCSLSDNAKAHKRNIAWAIAQDYELIVFNVSGVIALEKELNKTWQRHHCRQTSPRL